MSINPITNTPPINPDRTDRATFSTRMAAMWAWCTSFFGTEGTLNTFISECNMYADVIDNVSDNIDNIIEVNNNMDAVVNVNNFINTTELSENKIHILGNGTEAQSITDAVSVCPNDATIYGVFSSRTSIIGDYQLIPGGPYGFHGFEDYNNIDMTGEVNAYASAALSPTISGDSDYDHFKAVQCWPYYTSSGDMVSFIGMDVRNSHTGSGTITNNYGVYVWPSQGAGVIENDYGIYIGGVGRGSVLNYGIYNVAGKNYFGGSMGIGQGQADVSSGLAVADGDIRCVTAGKIFLQSSSQSKFGPADAIIAGGLGIETAIASYMGTDLLFGSGNVEKMRIFSTGGMRFIGGNIELNGSGGIFLSSYSQSKFGQASTIISGGSLTDTAIGFYSNLKLACQGTEVVSLSASGVFTPSTDNTQSFGSASKRWSVIYAGTGTINTSDERQKEKIKTFSSNEIQAAIALSKEIGTFRFLSSIKEKGNNSRIHIGLTVQKAIDIMEQNNLDPFAYGFICYDAWEDEFNTIDLNEDKGGSPKFAKGIVISQAGDVYGFRTDELLFFIAKGFEERLTAIENSI